MEVNIKAGKGYPSLTFLKKCSDELKERVEKYGFEPENIHILYCGDFDPSGENIDWYIQKRFKQLGIEGIHFERIAVTAEQIEEYNLPTEIVEKKPDKKAPNPNMNEFIRRHGNRATHLNAFFTPEHFHAFTEILRQAVDNDYFDEDIYDEMVEEYDIEADEPERMDEEELLDAKALMCKRVTEAFGKGWANPIVGEGYDDDEDDDTGT